MSGARKSGGYWLLGLSLAVSLGALSGCATQPVKAWERGQLATPEMAWEPDPALGTYRLHAQFGKEAASGQIGQAGGGCGCN